MNSRILSFVMALVLWPTFSWASGMDIVGATSREAEAAKNSLERVVAYFESIGAPVRPSFKIIFKDQVLLPNSDISVYGYFDTDTQEIHMLHFDNPLQSERRPWNQVWNDEMAESFLLHEITHMVAVAYMGEGFKSLSHAWHEAIAYNVQIKMMSPELRAAVAASVERREAYTGMDMVNSFIYESDPESFAYRISLSFPQWGGDALMKRLLSGEGVPLSPSQTAVP